MYFGPQIEYEPPSPFFVVSELPLSDQLTIFGRDLPELRAWAGKNGVPAVRHVTSSAAYAAEDHATVAHSFDKPIRLGQSADLSTCIGTLIGKAERLVLFVEIEDHCTAETVRSMLRLQLPDLTFRIVYPRGIYKASGLKVILIERRRPRIFLFLSGGSMAGKTETALSLADASKVTLVHGDNYLHQHMEGGDAKSKLVAQRMQEIHYRLDHKAPFDRVLFSQFVALIPELHRGEDVAFDFLMTDHTHLEVSQFFDELGFFPILCLMPADQKKLRAGYTAALLGNSEIEIARTEATFYRRQAEAYRNSFSWKLTMPLRLLSRSCRAIARSARFLINKAKRPTSASAVHADAADNPETPVPLGRDKRQP